MPINIEIKYPPVGVVTPEEIAALERHDAALKSKLVSITMKTYEKYEWFLDDSVTSQRYFFLQCWVTKEKICEKGIKELETMEPDDLVRELMFKAGKAQQEQ